ncbi:hypothetical protein FA13DRAFT_829382 [Coprinellus micaceus]|uniref:Uncharacterized protein n=1 Tax=Coprinellus micaceus TaxID=71717 RepID=A0A4Y7T3E1_COPMI|nr:hypothetical protein FA13DRAFT_829382 [Coprinellus micaceus]
MGIPHQGYGGYVPSPYVSKHPQHQRGAQLAPYEEDGDDDDDDFSNPESEYDDEGGLTTAQRRAYLAGRQLPTSPSHPSYSAYPNGNQAYVSQQQQQQMQQHQFNVRRASAKCREMDGMVSFAAVEGLGAPPDLDLSSSDDERRKRGET